MKILNRLPSIFSAAQRRELEKLLYQDIKDKKIIWRDVLTKAFSDRMIDLYQPYNISRIIGYSKIIPNQIIKKLEDIIIVLLSLISEGNQINNLIGKHEMFEKDVVKIYTDIQTNFLNMIDNTIKNYKLNMIEVKDGVISMFPDVQRYYPISVNTSFFPENVLKILGNVPTSQNITPGTESGYWITSILSKVKCNAGAELEFDFGGTIYFNNIVINSAGKYVLNINKLEIKENGAWVVVNSLNYQITTNKKEIVLTIISDPIRTKEIRLTLVQSKYDFIWSKVIDDTETYLEGIMDNNLNDKHSLLEEKGKLINDVILKDNFQRIIKKSRHNNIYEYILGCYNIAFLLNTFDGQKSGIFASKKYVTNNSIDTVKIVSEEYKPTDSTIQYNIIQSDESQIDDVTINQAVSLDKEFSKSQIFSNITGNVITLSSYPLENSVSVKINGRSFDSVEKFSQTSEYEYIVKKNKIFINKNLTGLVVNVEYTHHSDYVIIQIEMKTNTTYASSQTPKVTSFDVKLNEI